MKKGVQSVLFSVLVGALLLCAGCGKSGDIYTAGVYTASAEGYSGPVTVEVEFDGSSILSVHVLSHSETVNISDRAIDEIPSHRKSWRRRPGMWMPFHLQHLPAMPFVKRSEIASRGRRSDEPFALQRVFCGDRMGEMKGKSKNQP